MGGVSISVCSSLPSQMVAEAFLCMYNFYAGTHGHGTTSVLDVLDRLLKLIPAQNAGKVPKAQCQMHSVAAAQLPLPAHWAEARKERDICHQAIQPDEDSEAPVTTWWPLLRKPSTEFM